MTDNQRDWAEEKAAKISLEIPGNWPDTKSQKARIEYIAAALREAMERQKKIDAELIPTNWVDSMLTGGLSVIGKPPYGCPAIEALLNALRERILSQRDDTKKRT